MKIIFFLLVLAPFILNKTNLKNPRHFLASVKRTDFGSSILKTLQLQLSQDSPSALQNVNTFLKDMKSSIKEEQDTDDIAYEETKTESLNKIEELKSNIAGYETDIINLNNLLNEYEKALESEKTVKASKEDQKKLNEDDLEAKTLLREEQYNNFVTINQDLEDGINAIRKVIPMIMERFGVTEDDLRILQPEGEIPPLDTVAAQLTGAEFIQLKKKISSKKSKYGSIIALLLEQNVENIRKDQAVKFIILLQEFLSKMVADKQAATIIEDGQQSEYDEISAKLHDTINTLTSEITQSAAAISNYHSLIASTKSSIDTKESLLHADQEELETKTAF